VIATIEIVLWLLLQTSACCFAASFKSHFYSAVINVYCDITAEEAVSV